MGQRLARLRLQYALVEGGIAACAAKAKQSLWRHSGQMIAEDIVVEHLVAREHLEVGHFSLSVVGESEKAVARGEPQTSVETLHEGIDFLVGDAHMLVHVFEGVVLRVITQQARIARAGPHVAVPVGHDRRHVLETEGCAFLCVVAFHSDGAWLP